MTEKKSQSDPEISQSQITEYSNKAINGLIWVASTSVVWQLISWVFTILTARVLAPSDFGTFALVQTLMPYLSLILSFNMAAWYIQTTEMDANIEKTIFTLSVSLGLFTSVLCFCIAPYVGDFYGNPDIVLPIRVLSINYAIWGISLLPGAQLKRELKFKTVGLINATVGVCQVILVYILAVLDFGFWAFVIGLNFRAITITVWECMLTGLPTRFGLDIDVTKKILRFGMHATGANIFWVIFATSDNVLIGKFLGVEILGYYSMAFYLMEMPLSKLGEIFRPILLSYYSRIKEHSEKLNIIFLDIVKTTIWLLYPILLGLALISNELVPIVFGEKWLPMAFPLTILCVYGLARAIADIIHPLILSLGRPDIDFKINLLSVMIMPISFYFMINIYGMVGALMVWIVVYPLVPFLFVRAICMITGISKITFIKNLFVPLTLSAVMSASVILVRFLLLNSIDTIYLLLIEIITGVVVYSVMSYLFFHEEIIRSIKLMKSR